MNIHTDIKFIQNAEPEEIMGVIESFLNRWKDMYSNKEGLSKGRELYLYMPTDKESYEIVQDMIKSFKRYKI